MTIPLWIDKPSNGARLRFQGANESFWRLVRRGTIAARVCSGLTGGEE
jgi:hypothetical protein